MTLTQLRAFALVARLGSLRAAAAVLGISEPAVSTALTALRADLGDPLFVRAGGGIALTPGGHALARHAQEIVGLAEQARADVAQAGPSTARLRVLATAAFEEHASRALLDAFTRRVPDMAVDVTVGPSDGVATALIERSADIALGAKPLMLQHVTMDVVPFLRYTRVVVAAPGHPLASAAAPVPVSTVLQHRWLTGHAGIEVFAEEGKWLFSQSRLPELVRLPNETDALAAVRAGDGIALALSQVVRRDIDRGLLVRVPVSGTPIQGVWYASTLGLGRAKDAAKILQRYVTTPDATAAMLASRRGDRPGPTVHVGLWS
ncbi:MAG: LysR family transcriptional regulator [Allobranchiibius sp.]|jgi:DNA-binding transcriptional LysR family regulator